MTPSDRGQTFGASALRAMGVSAAVLAGAWGCARQGVPPGGPVDRIPPYVISTEPDTFAVVEPFDGSVRVEFSERISERVTGGIDRAVEVSPRTGEVEVDHHRRSLSISMRGGFQAGRVYRITILPVIVDMFGNTLADPFEFFFSTGPDFNPNALAGVLTDRITGEPVAGARVDARREGEDSAVYTTVSDDEGIFALRTIPEGTYDVQAYADVNHSFEADFAEPQARMVGEDMGAADTSIVFMALLQPDTTPARLLTATAVDSLSLELSFDDFMDPDSSLDGVAATLSRDTAEVAAGAPEGAPAVALLLRPPDYEAFVQARADSLAAAEAAAAAAADTSAVDTLPVDTLPVEPAPPTPAPQEPPAGPEPPVLPSQLIYAILGGPLEPDARYTVSVTGVTNIVGLPGGGGETQFTAPPLPEPDSLPTDSLPADSLPTDSLPGDTLGGAADTAGTPDTAPQPTPPDTTGADTVRLTLLGRPAPARGERPRPLLRRLRD